MKWRNGIYHTRNAYSTEDKFWKNKCIPYIEYYKKHRLKNIQLKHNRIPDEYDKRDVMTHLMHCYTDMFFQTRIGRKKKYVIRQMFKYWYKQPGAYLNPDSYVDYDILVPYPMYSGNRNDVRFPVGTPGCYILYITFFKRNKKTLTKKQQKLLSVLHSHRENLNNEK